MDIKEKVVKQQENNFELLKETEKLMCKVEIKDDSERDILLVGFSRNLLTHFISMEILIKKKLYNSAFALVRVFFENAVRLQYMYFLMADVEITKFYNSSGNIFKKTIGEMANEVDQKHRFNRYSDIKNSTYKAMCDYTHTGAQQIASNFNESSLTVEPTFSDKKILDVLEGNKELLKMTIIIVLKAIGLKESFLSETEIDQWQKL